MSCVLGVDPGLTGALALCGQESGELIAVEDMPTLRIGKKTAIDAYGLARIIDNLISGLEVTAWLEHVASSPQMGVASAFAFGRGLGVIQGVLAAGFIPMHVVTPPAWKAAMKCRGEKDESRARACAIWPRQSALFARVKDHGRADACLVALYGVRAALEGWGVSGRIADSESGGRGV